MKSPRFLWLIPVVAGGCVILSIASFGQTSFVLSMGQVMTASELKESGVADLTPPQRAALDKWLNRYTDRILRVTAENSTGRYSGVGSGHWISEVSGNGTYIKLEDRSFWEVNAIDRIDTSLWLAISNITVLVAKDPVGDYKYELVNTDDGEKALARYLGKP